MEEGGYHPIGSYGVIGDLETCALVGPEGAIDWCCLPHLESPSLFAALLDHRRGGRFRLGPAATSENISAYLPGTNVLGTAFRCSSGLANLVDFMPPRHISFEKRNYPKAILRKLECLEGEVEFCLEFSPRFDYARDIRDLEPREGGCSVSWRHLALQLFAPCNLALCGPDGRGTFCLHRGERAWAGLVVGGGALPDADQCEEILESTLRFWRRWVHGCAEQGCLFEGPQHDLVIRSELTLKLLTHKDSGAMAAAATTSLPEQVGGVRNWDYRFAWLRDASLTAQALHSTGHGAEGQAFFDWVRRIRPAPAPSGRQEFQVMYGLHGELDLEEQELPHLEGYRRSKPVRIGNAAFRQRQLDIYGELLLALYDLTRYGTRLEMEDWAFIQGVAAEVVARWRLPDSGIWEVRGGPRHFTYSKLMCWVALDRALKIARSHHFNGPLAQWERVRGEIRGAILSEGFDGRRNTFLQAFGHSALDAALLLIPQMGLLPFNDPRVQGTVRAIKERLTVGGVVRRYEGEDGLPGKEGAFLICTFWLVNAMALSGHLEEAESLYHGLLGRVGPLGLLSEQINPATGDFLGNYPQAFSHVGLINSAIYLGRARGLARHGPAPLGDAGPGA